MMKIHIRPSGRSRSGNRPLYALAPALLALAVPLHAHAALATSTTSSDEGFFAGSHAGLKLRSYTDFLSMKDAPDRSASVLSTQAWVASGWTPGPVGFSVTASMFTALTLGSSHAGNMAYAGSPAGEQRRSWAYPGLWSVQARAGDTLVKYGLLLPEQDASLVPHDNRALPPTFRGATLASEDVPGLKIMAGSFDKVIARGQDGFSGLKSEYAKTPISRFSYVGATYQLDPSTQLTVNGAQARDVWNQYYASAQHSIGDPSSLQWTARADYYHTGDTGRARGGQIRNDAYSIALTAQHQAHAVTLAYQQILGDQFFDYMGESADDRLANSMDVDYNAPHERSLQLRYTVDMRDYGTPGLKVMLWGVKGWGADASNMAHSLQEGTAPHDLYWSGGKPVQGSHSEIGIIPSYEIQSSTLRGSTVVLTLMHHTASAHYSDPSSNVARLMLNVPLAIF